MPQTSDSPDKAQQKRAELSAARLHSFGKLGHGSPKQAAEVTEVCSLCGIQQLIQLFQKQNSHIPALNHTGPGTSELFCGLMFSTVSLLIIFIFFLELLLWE